MITIKRAAELTGVPEATLRIWERRYGIGAPSRSASGYRLYDTAAIVSLKEMQRLVDEGWSPQQAAGEVRGRALAPRTSEDSSPSPVGGEATDKLRAEFFEAVQGLDSAALARVLDVAFAAGSFEHVVDHWLVPTLRELGERWLTNESDIASEHFASHAIMRRLGAAFEAAGQPTSGPRILIGTPSGSLHEIGALAFATAVRRRGLPVVYLGVGVPPESWVAAAQRHAANAVAISVPMSGDVASAQSCVDALLRLRPRVTVTVGGAAATGVVGSELVLEGGVAESAAMLAGLLT